MEKSLRELLLKDLSARLSYGVKVMGKNMYISNIDAIHNLKFCILVHLIEVDKTLWIEDVKPYLRPMSSMTEEEKIELCTRAYAPDDMKTLDEKLYVIQTNAKNAADFYNEHHLDYRGLIPMGLALEAPADMYV